MSYMRMRVFSDVTPSAVHVGNIVQGVRLAWAQGRDIGFIDDDSDNARKVRRLTLLVVYFVCCKSYQPSLW